MDMLKPTFCFSPGDTKLAKRALLEDGDSEGEGSSENDGDSEGEGDSEDEGGEEGKEYGEECTRANLPTFGEGSC